MVACPFISETDRAFTNDFRPGGVGILFPAPGTQTDSGEFDDTAIGVFGQATLTLWDRLDLTAGLRYDYEDKEADIQNLFVTVVDVVEQAEQVQ